MEFDYELLLYLDKRRFLSKMKESCRNYLDDLTEKLIAKFPPLRCSLEIDVMDLLNTYANLGESLLKEPYKWQRVCNDILFACLQSENHLEKMVESEQVAVNIRLKCVPQLLSPTNLNSYSGIVSFYGQLIAISKPFNYVYHSVWSCPEGCEGSVVILHYIPKAPPKCCMCRSALFENCGLRRCSEKINATFITKDGLLPKNFALVDDLITKVKLGANYTIIGMVLKKTVTVWSIEETRPLAAPLKTHVFSDIEKLYQRCGQVSWNFIYSLASSIGLNVCPLSCFMHLKMSMLMSLVSVKSCLLTGSSVIHVLAAGYDTSPVGRLLLEGAKLADRSVSLGTAYTNTSTALIGSSGGVCVMSLPLQAYSHKHISAVLSAVEAGKVTIDTNTVPLRTAVWAQGRNFKKISLLNIAWVFGYVCRGDQGEHTDEVADFALQNAIDPPKTTKEAVNVLKDLVSYIDIVGGVEVTIDQRAESVLRRYFQAARKENPRGVPAGSMAGLVTACLTAARLCRRPAAGVDDATLAIWLHMSGGPDPRLAPEEYLQTPNDIQKLHKMMICFKEWLMTFIGMT